MILRRLILINIFLTIITLSYGQKIEVKENELNLSQNKMDNPTAVIEFTLQNGLTVYIHQDLNMNSVLGAIVVRGGSKNDPEDATGIAHYLEHLLFKGTNKIGTIDYKSEKIWLDSIYYMYSMLPYTKGDEEYRKRVYKKIDFYSQKASKYAIPGEFDKIISLMGGKNLNAFTDFEKIVYYNEFPSDYMSEWLTLYKERFENAVFRLFQTELETVFEEKNMSQDNLYVSVYEEVYKYFYPNSTYGNRTILGSVEHLKNPSLQKMATYYKKNYVSNNMALILVGNFNTESTKDQLNKIFGNFRNGEPQTLKVEKESQFEGRIQHESNLTPLPMGVLGFRTPGQFHNDIPAIDIITNMLNNRQNTGFLDLVNKENKLMYSMVVSDFHSDLGGVFIGFAPKFPIQSLASGEKLIRELLQKIKRGDFTDLYLESIKNILIQSHELNLENADFRMRKIAETFVAGSNWEYTISYPKKIRALTKNDIISIANQYFGDNYLAFYSHRGTAKKERLVKPQLTPFKPIENHNSIYFNDFSLKLMNSVTPKYLIKNIDFKTVNLNPGVNYYHVQNPYNEIFNYNLMFYVGDYQIQGLEMAAFYLNKVGTKELKFADFQKRLQEMGTMIEISANESFFIVKMTGFDKNFEESLILLNQLLTQPEIDKNAGKQFISARKIENRILKHDLNMKSRALTQYALYGKNSTFIHRPSIKQLKKYTTDNFEQFIKEALTYKVDISYTGKLTAQNIQNLVIKHQYFSRPAKNGNSPIIKEMQLPTKTTIYTLEDKKAIQSRISITVPSSTLSRETRNLIQPYNLYFGLGSNSIVFKEIREYKALAYSASANFRVPYNYTAPGYLYCSTSTQSDKTYDLLFTFYKLLDSLKNGDDLTYLTTSLKNSINIELPDFRSTASLVAYWQLMGYETDPREEQFKTYSTMRPNEIINFHENQVAKRNKVLTILGSEVALKAEELTNFGQIKKIKFKQIYTQ